MLDQLPVFIYSANDSVTLINMSDPIACEHLRGDEAEGEAN